MYVMDLPRQFFMIRFEEEGEYMAALTGGPWRVFGSYLMVQAWSPMFDPMKDEIATTPVWVRLSNLPVNFYHTSILMGIAKGLGKPVKVDLTTSNLERARFARVCVEVNLKKALKGTILVNGERYYASYEGLTNICSLCGLYGHLVHACPKNVQEQAAPMNVERGEGMENRKGVSQAENEFTLVRNGGRRSGSERNRRALVVREGEDGRRDTYVTHPGKDLTIVPIANSFERLVDDLESQETREVGRRMEENKENCNTMNQVGQRGSGRQGKGIVFTARIEKPLRESQNGRRGRRSGNSKEHEKISFKSVLNNRSTRGLIFGPVGGETEFSASGKRMRVEKEKVEEQSGGVVRSNLARVEENTLIPMDTQLTRVTNQCEDPGCSEIVRLSEMIEDGRGNQEA